MFGIAGLSLARPCEKDKDAILAACRDFLDSQLRTARTFKVETKRADKSFPMTSIQLSQYVGGELHEAYGNLEVDVHHPELTVYIEVRDYAAYVHAQPQPGAGGLPVGINGRAVSLLSGGIDSPVASWMIAKRGWPWRWCISSPTPTPLRRPRRRCWSWPACSPPTPAASPSMWSLHRHSGGAAPLLPGGAVHHHHAPLYDAHFPGGGQAVRGQGPGHRRVPGPGGQPDHGGHAGHRLCGGAAHPAPLVGMDKEEIVQIARKIGTFETSILPYEDCCTVFTPRHPRLRPMPGEVEAAEQALDIEAMVQAAVDGIERVQVNL